MQRQSVKSSIVVKAADEEWEDKILDDTDIELKYNVLLNSLTAAKLLNMLAWSSRLVRSPADTIVKKPESNSRTSWLTVALQSK